MSNRPVLACVAVIAAVFAFQISRAPDYAGPSPGKKSVSRQEAVDNDWFMLQRAFPKNDVDPGRYEAARQATRQMAGTQGVLSSAAWQSVGPSNVGGRITAIALHPANAGVIYAGAAAGGVWKSTDGGVTWNTIFNGSPSTGSLILDPTNPEIVYVGTGEGNPGGVAIYPGNGIWKSTNAGLSWTQLPGLTTTGQIGALDIHPSAPNRIFAAALGLYRSRTQERGVYRSTDFGASWQRVLFVNDTTGACEVLIDPANADRVYAATWTRHRPLTYSVLSSEHSALYLSTNAGNTWAKLTNGIPSNDVNLGRISLAVAPSQPGTVYALAASGVGVGGIYKSTDSGNLWTQVSTGAPFGSESQVWYNNVLAVHPTAPSTVYAGMTALYRSTNGGVNWQNVTGSIHADMHAIKYDRTNPNRIVAGSDGGVFSTTNGGSSWTKSLNLPISQFYAGTVDSTNPRRYYGGLQDNGTQRTLTGNQNDWGLIYGGDGFYVLVDPRNADRMYAEYQNGGLAYSTNGGSSFFTGTNGITGTDRTNWSTPFVMDLNTTLTLYVGTFRVYRTTNGMQSWTAISGDLTRGANGRIGTITTVDVARSNPGVIYAGTDDGKVSVTTNGGTGWNDITGTLPTRWVTRVTIDPDSAGVCYVTLSGYLEYSYQSHIYKTTNFGQTWRSLRSNLPDVPLNDVIVDPAYRPYLYVASDVGVFYSSNQGTSWSVLGTSFPEVPVHDLTLHSPSRTLVAFTHGRSVYTLDVTGLNPVESPSTTPIVARLYQNYPNPFNPTTTIRFELSQAGVVALSVFDLQGREVKTIVRERLAAGVHERALDAGNLASGMYFYRLTAGDFTSTRRLIVLK